MSTSRKSPRRAALLAATLLLPTLLAAESRATTAARPFQSETPATKKKRRVISGGVLDERAVSKPRPVYPGIALAARASGEVSVQVTVDENGDVTAASAVSGHPLLRQAAERAARRAKFKPEVFDGEPVAVTGTLNYKFVFPKPKKRPEAPVA
jgi:protein TonB